MGSKKLKAQLKKEGFDKNYIQKILLPNTGLKDYKGKVNFEVEKLATFGYGSGVFGVDVFGNGELLRRFIIKEYHQTVKRLYEDASKAKLVSTRSDFAGLLSQSGTFLSSSDRRNRPISALPIVKRRDFRDFRRPGISIK